MDVKIEADRAVKRQVAAFCEVLHPPGDSVKATAEEIKVVVGTRSAAHRRVLALAHVARAPRARALGGLLARVRRDAALLVRRVFALALGAGALLADTRVAAGAVGYLKRKNT